MKTCKVPGYVLLGLLVACGGNDNDKKKGSDTFAVVAAPQTVSVSAGGSATVQVTLQRPTTLATSSVALSVSGAPAKVTATFDSSSITTDAATLTVTAAADAATGDSTLTITATPDSATGVAAAQTMVTLSVIPPTPITITGTARGSRGVPLGNAVVHVLAAGAPATADTTTDASGAFTVANILPPYDVNVVPDSGHNLVFLGLTTATPALSSFFFDPDPPASEPETDVHVTGGASGQKFFWIFEGANGGTACEGNITSNNATLTGYPVAPPDAGSTTNAALRGVSFTPDADDNPDTYQKYVEVAHTYNNSGVNVVDVALSSGTAVDTHSITVQASTAVGGPVADVGVTWLLGTLIDVAVFDAAPSAVESTIKVPFLASGTTAPLMFSASDANGSFVARAITTTTTEIDVTLPPTPTGLTPANAALGVNDATVFAGPALTNATYVFVVVNDAKTRITYLASATPSFPASRLRALSAGLAPSATYELAFVQVVSGTSLDILAPERSQRHALYLAQPSVAVSPFQTFSTSP